jgi:hypothetical protein
MSYGIGITTAKRATDYLTPLLRGMWGIDFLLAPTMPGDIPTEFCLHRALDPFMPADATAHERNEARALEVNTDRMMRALAEDHDVFLTLQDDIRPCRNVWDRIGQCADYIRTHPRVAWISFYTPYRDMMRCREALWPYPAGKFYGELALLWNRTAAIEFLEAEKDPGLAHDLQIQRHFAGTGWLTYGHIPCLFQHMGVESATGKPWNQGQRITPNFHPAADAMSCRRLPP